MALRASAGSCVSALPGVLLLGMENAISLTVLRELGEHGVPVHGVARSARSIAVASRHCRGWTLRPAGPIATWLPQMIARTGVGAVLAIAEHGCLLNAPDVYMDKIAVGPGYPAGVIDLDKTPTENIKAIAAAKGVGS